MAQYNISDITQLFWASNDGFKGGRDPMGIQNSSVATYSCLLPGMTNLTGHIRYYSLYCWLLSEYDRLQNNNPDILHQYNFIRRAELAMAFIMKDQGVGSVIGAQFIQHNNYKVDDDGNYLIGAGADYKQEHKYWAFNSGALGQYYLGSLIHYELVKVVEGRFYLCDKGKALADDFVESVNEQTRALFLSCILHGVISDDMIEKLQSIGIHNIDKNSPEWVSLNNLLTMEDRNGSKLRRESVYLMLKDIADGIPLEDYVTHRFLAYKDTDEMEASFGWHFYYLCEALHYAIETLFCFVLSRMDELENPPISLLMEDTTAEILSKIEDISDISTVEELGMITEEPVNKLLSDVKENIKRAEYAKAAADSIRLLVRLHKEYLDKEEPVKRFEGKHDLKRQRGIFSEGLKSYVIQHLQSSPKEYVESLVRQVMNEHTVVAVRKMGGSDLDLRKFIFEDGRTVLIEMRYPNPTSPRIRSLHNYLIDLKYLDDKNNLTEIALKYILHYGEE